MKLRRRGAASANPLTDDLSKLVGLLSDFFLVFSFDHHASQVLSSRIPQQQAPLPAQLPFEFIGSGVDLGNRHKWRLALNAHVNQDLWVPGHSRCKLRSEEHTSEL